LDGPPEKSIVEAVGFVLETCGVTASGIDWGKVAAVVAGGVCGWCDGGGFIDCVPPVRCSSCAAIATAAAMVERENRRSVLEFLELCGVGLEAFRADGFGAFVDAGATVSRWQAALSSGAFSVFDDCSDLGDVLAEAERVLGVTE
jgi:hypothetical protein